MKARGVHGRMFRYGSVDLGGEAVAEPYAQFRREILLAQARARHQRSRSQPPDQAAVDRVLSGSSTRCLAIASDSLIVPPVLSVLVTHSRCSKSAAQAGRGLEPIAGLLAAGELVGRIFRFNCPGGNGLMSGAVFVRTASASAAAGAPSRPG